MFVKFSFCLFFQALTDEQLWRCILFFISYVCVIAEVVMSFFVDKPSALPPNVSASLFLSGIIHVNYKIINFEQLIKDKIIETKLSNYFFLQKFCLYNNIWR